MTVMDPEKRYTCEKCGRPTTWDPAFPGPVLCVHCWDKSNETNQYRREYFENYYQQNREKILERSMQYYMDNKERIRRWNKKNRQRRAEYLRQWRKNQRSGNNIRRQKQQSGFTTICKGVRG